MTVIGSGPNSAYFPTAINRYGHASIYGGLLYNGTTVTSACPSATSFYGFGLNDNDTVVGHANVKVKGSWWAHLGTCTAGVFRDLVGSAFPTVHSDGMDVNSLGNAVGYANDSYWPNSGDGTDSATAILAQNGSVKNLGTFGGTSGHAWAINNSGQVVGDASLATSIRHAFLYQGAGLTDLGALPNLPDSSAHDINNNGDIAGWSRTRCSSPGCFYGHAFLIPRGGSMIDIGTLPGDTTSMGHAINNLGDVVGESEYYCDTCGWAGGYVKRPFIYHQGFMYDLSQFAAAPPGLVFNTAYGINDSGQIAIDAFSSNAEYALILTPSGSLPSPAPVNTAPPAVTGNPIVGFSLAGSPGSWSVLNGAPSPTYAYQWQRCSGTGGGCTPIPGATTSNYAVSTGDVGSTFRLHVVASNSFGSTSADSALTAPADTPLHAFAPQLRYDSEEQFSADAAGEITDSCQSGENGNFLLDGGEAPLAMSCPAVDGLGQLSLSYLGANYGGGATATSSDHIDEYDNYKHDYDQMHQLAQYADTIYGRVISNPDGSAIVQYWFFYYDQPNFFWGDTGGGHEGDWEAIQIYVDQNGVPIDRTYSQHKDAELCGWSFGTTVGLHPVVFVAHGSHASYFVAGSHEIWSWHGIFTASDRADGGKPGVIPTVIDMDSLGSWVAWPGRWGGTEGGNFQWLGIEQVSPQGPSQHGDQWSNPMIWQSSKSCNE